MRIRTLALMLAAAAAAGRLAAQDPSAAAPARADDPVLASLIEEALARSPDLLAARETIVAARTKLSLIHISEPTRPY